MKKYMPVITLLTIFFLMLSCASAQTSSPGLSLDDALEQAAAQLASLLPGGSRVAVVNFDFDVPALSGYLIDETGGYLYGSRKLKIVTRKNLELLMKELDWNMSGYVSDETAQGIGKMLGAEIIISGALVNRGSDYRLRLTAIQTETALVMGSAQLIIQNNKQIKDLAASAQSGASALPQNTEVYIDEADMAFSDGYTAYMVNDYNKAITEFTKAISLNPRFAYAYLYRGIAYSGKRDQKQASDNINKAIELYPKFDKAYYYRGKAFATAENYEKAIADYSQAIAINQNDAEYYHYRGIAYGYLEKLDQEIADYNKSISLKPDNAEVYYLRGSAYAIKRDFNAAVSDLTRSIGCNPNYAEAYRFRAGIYALHGQFFQAIEDYNQVLKINPKDKEALEMLERIRSKM